MATEPLIAHGEIQSRVAWEEYAAMSGVNITRLKELRRSPLHYLHSLASSKDTDALRVGSAAHVAILEPERFARDHAVWAKRTESGRMAPRSGKAWDAFEADNAGKRILTADEFEDVLAMQKAVRADATAMRYLRSGDPEVTMRWTDGGFACKGRVDWLAVVDGRRTVVGLKTARDCRPFIFGSAAAKLGYHLQWGFYRDGYEAITGDAPRMIEIVVENAPPYAVATYIIPPDITEQGRDEYKALLELLAKCQAENHWPGPVSDEQVLTLPSWVYAEAQSDDLSDLGLE